MGRMRANEVLCAESPEKQRSDPGGVLVHVPSQEGVSGSVPMCANTPQLKV